MKAVRWGLWFPCFSFSFLESLVAVSKPTGIGEAASNSRAVFPNLDEQQHLRVPAREENGLAVSGWNNRPALSWVPKEKRGTSCYRVLQRSSNRKLYRKLLQGGCRSSAGGGLLLERRRRQRRTEVKKKKKKNGNSPKK